MRNICFILKYLLHSCVVTSNVTSSNDSQVFHVSLPDLIERDGLMITGKPLFTVPGATDAQYQKAIWYVKNESSNMYCYECNDGDEIYTEYYLLSKTSTLPKTQSIDANLVSW